MKKRRILALAMCSLLLAGCAGRQEAANAGPAAAGWHDAIKGGKIEVGVLSAKGTPGLRLLEDLAAQLGKDYKGADISLTFANTQARPGIEQRWRAGTPPDVDYGMFDGTNPSLVEWADDGALLDLKPYLQQNDPQTGKPWLDRFSPTVRAFMSHPKSGGVYGVPSELSLHVLFYNAKLFKDNALKPPATWDDLIAASDALKAKGVAPIALTGLFEPYMGMWSDHLWLRTVGYDKARGVLSEGKGHITEDPGFLKGLQMLQDLRDKDAFLQGFKGTDFTAAQAQFFQGKAGMILMGSWLVSEMKDVIPKDFQIGVVAFPTVPGGAGDQSALMAALQQMSISAKSRNIPLALEWARRLTSVETQTRRAHEIGEVSAVTGVPSPPGIPGIDQVLASADALKPRAYGITESKASKVVYPEIARLLFGEQDAAQTLERLDKGLRRVYGN
ncbi:ABC transporter substrate-binding protein [Nonomuraea basaltis]|uniref:ABC transporter substrate-binding protein n=1 Tax=Nonomuraea basaltis TaxID=2495887 RepID=UPI00110C410F|nr:extracellular solute-binding protein [Nonomuraea basaltis]TMR96569.1 extracellular solute-binding protein [Nonomuraea basaltis]